MTDAGLERARDRLVQALGAEAVIVEAERLEEYASDYTEEAPRRPGLVARPARVEEVQALTRIAAEEGLSVTVRVAGSNVGGLAIPPEGGIVVDLRRMNRIVEVNREDMVAVIEPGVTWEQLKAHLQAEKIPLRMGYPLSPPDTSIVANCLLDGLGNLSMRYGAMADWIGGLEVVLPDGSLCRTGAPALLPSPALRDASGGGAQPLPPVWFGRGPLPDLSGLFVCFQGTTGIVTKLGFQLWPEPPHRRRTFILMYDRNGAFRAMRELARRMICDDVGGLSWPTGKMLFGVDKPGERDPGEPEFFLYLDLTGQTARELELRGEVLSEVLDGLRREGFELEAPLDVATLVRLNPRFAKLADFPTRLEFLVDHPGGGLSWVGTYGPLSRFEAYGDRGVAIMARHGFAPILVSRPMKGGHFGVMRFIATFDKKSAEERARVREMSGELVDAGVELGFIPYKTPPWVVERIRARLDPGFLATLARVRGALDPRGTMAPRCWPGTGPVPTSPGRQG
jgi:glycolate oxidase